MPSYRLIDANNQEINLHNLQDKGPWCQAGATFEQVFIATYPQLNLQINPAKSNDPYAPDLLNNSNQKLGDLKTQNTPFFQATQRYGLNPQFAVTFNVKDYKRYTALYPGIEIYFWVKWTAIKFEKNGQLDIGVQPMEGVWRADFSQVAQLCNSSPIHTYAQRVNDDRGNARDSYVLSLNDPTFIRLI
jgi:hypothetical protein